MEIKIEDLFKSIRVIHPRAYKVMRALLNAYPPGHFKACMQEAIGNDIISVDAKKNLK